MRRFLVVSRYDWAADSTVRGNLYTADNPFDAVLQDCMTRTDERSHEACTHLEESTHIIMVWEYFLNGDIPKEIPYDDIGLPWLDISVLVQKIKALEVGIERAAELNVLAEVPGLEDVNTSLNLAPAYAHLQTLRQQRRDMKKDWELRKTPGVRSRERNIDLKPTDGK